MSKISFAAPRVGVSLRHSAALGVLAASVVAVAAPAGAGAAQPALQGREEAGLATATTRSFRQDDGSVVQRIYGVPVNVQDAQGRWRHVDTALKPSGGALQPAATSTPVSIPTTLGGAAVTVGPAGRRVALKPLGLTGSAKVNGDTAVFRSAAPGLTAQVAALAGGVKQTYVLDDPSAPDHLDVALEVSDGLTVKAAKDGGASVVGADGDVRYELSPTVGWAGDDSAKAKPVSSTVTKTADGWRLRIDLSASWIRQAIKQGTVTIDPTLNLPTPTQDALLRPSTPSATGLSAASGTIAVGPDARSLLKFDLSAIPEDARVLDATVAAFVQSGPTAGKDIALHEVTADWTQAGASWNTRTAGVNWATAGGDVLAAPSDTALEVAGDNGWTAWHPTTLAQRWVTGTSKNYGLQLRTSTAGAGDLVLSGLSATGDYAGTQPYVQVRYAPAAGQRRDDTFLSESLNDRSKMGIAVASGNLLLSSQDVSINGVGQPLSLARTYNSGLSNYQTGSFGNGGTSNLSGDVRLVTLAGGDIALHLGDGSVYRYPKNTGGTYDPAARLEADLVRKADNTYELTYRRSQAKWRFSTDGKLTQMVDKSATPNAISLTYTGTGVLQSITDTQGRVLPTTVNANGQITKITDPTNRTWNYVYGGPNGKRLLTYTDPEGGVTTYTYDSSSRVKSITTPEGSKTLISYDADGRVAEYIRVTDTSDNSGPTTRLRYDQTTTRCPGALSGKTTIVTDPRGNETTYCVNDKLQVVRTTDAKLHDQATTYNSQGQVEQFTNGTGTGSAIYKSSYASLTNNLTDTKGPLGETTTQGQGTGTSLTEKYQPTSATSADGKSQFFGYDAQGNVTSVKDAPTGQTPSLQSTLTYNPNGTIATAKDGKNNQTTYGYWTAADGGTRAGLLKSVAMPLRGTQTLNYDTLGRITSAVDGNGVTTTYTYDKLDRVKTDAAAGGNTMTYYYDKDGNEVHQTDSSEGEQYASYDALNRRISETLTGSRVSSYTYDDAGNLTAIADSEGITGYGYNEVNQNCYVAPTDPGGGSCVTPPSGATTFRYNANGSRTKTIYPNGVTVAEAPDLSGKPTSISAGTGANALSRVYTYAGAAELGSGKTGELVKSMQVNGGPTSNFTYDGSGRLATLKIGATAGVDQVTYGYDNAGNRTSFSVAANAANTIGAYSQTSTYNAANQLVTQQKNTAGTGSTNRSFTYDQAGNDASYSYSKRNATVYGTYGGLYYRGANQANLRQDGNYFIEPNLLGLSRRYDPNDIPTSYLRAPDGTLLARKAPGNVWSYYLNDAQGSVIGVYDAAGAVSKKYDYDPDGNVWRQSSGKPEDFGYAGAYTRLGAQTLYKNGLRWYDPVTGRWTQADSLDQPGDLQNANPYLYVASDPINNIDPSGMSLWGDVKDVAKEGVAGAIGGAVSGAISGAPLGPAGMLSGAASGAAYGFGSGVASGTLKKAGAPKKVVDTAFAARGIYTQVKGFGKNLHKAIETTGK